MSPIALRPRRRRSLADINVAPLVDVVLVLLIIFMVLTPLAEGQKQLRVPADAPELQPVAPDRVAPDQTVLTLLASGRVRLDAEEMTLAEALPRLRAAYEGRPSRVLFFDAEDRVRYDVAVQVLDAAHGAGVRTIGVITDPPAAVRP